MRQILIYSDQGVYEGLVKQLFVSLKQEVDPRCHSIRLISSNALVHEAWESESALLIMPGGRDCYYHAALDGAGTDKIRAFVKGGGGYLGICGGAYFACDQIEFSKGKPLEVCQARSLKFFPGIARGPAYSGNPYSYESASGARAARISWDGKSCHLYFNGGCQFEPYEKSSEMHVLSRYLDLDNASPAILRIPVGKGVATLSGVHFEYQLSSFPKEDLYLSRVFPLLLLSEEGRKRIFREILQSHAIRLH